jgi:hypothetical protein
MVDSIPDSVKTIHRNLISTDSVDYVSRRKSKYYLAQCRDNVSEWSQMSSYTRDNMSEWSQMSSYTRNNMSEWCQMSSYTRDNMSGWSQMSSYARDNMSEWSQMSSYKLAPCKFQPSVLVYGIK